MNISDEIHGGVVVSCQAGEGSPFRDADAMWLMVRAAIEGGASAIRVESVDHVRRMSVLDVPLIGLVKRREPGSEVYITPRARDVRDLIKAGAHVVALDATPRLRPGGETLAELVEVAHDLGALVLGDIDSVATAHFAEDSGVDWIGTTLAGYTAPRTSDGPDIELVGAITRWCSVPVVAEGRYSRPDQLRAAFANGAWSVVVGTAISDPVRMTRRFVEECPKVAETRR